jgi:hypothetical protein
VASLFLKLGSKYLSGKNQATTTHQGMASQRFQDLTLHCASSGSSVASGQQWQGCQHAMTLHLHCSLAYWGCTGFLGGNIWQLSTVAKEIVPR